MFILLLSLCILIVVYVLFCIFCFHRANWHSSATLTEVFPWFFLSCKANARVQLAKTGHGPHSSQLEVVNPLNAELNPICHLLALLGAHHIFHVSGLRVKCVVLCIVCV